MRNTFCVCPQGEDLALPEVPTEPIPEVPEAAKAEPGTVEVFSSFRPQMIFSVIHTCVTDVRLIENVLTWFSREERSKEQAGERDAGGLTDRCCG